MIGPIPPLLTHLDITNAQLDVLWLVIPFPYWVALGLVAGLIGWKGCADETQKERREEQGLRRTRVATAMLVFGGGLCSFPLYPSVFSGGSSPENMIKNNLRIVEGCKDQFALEKKLLRGQVVKEEDLAPYIKGGTIRHVGTERYILNPVGVPCYAVLDADWRIRRKGWDKGRTIPKGKEFRQ